MSLFLHRPEWLDYTSTNNHYTSTPYFHPFPLSTFCVFIEISHHLRYFFILFNHYLSLTFFHLLGRDSSIENWTPYFPSSLVQRFKDLRWIKFFNYHRVFGTPCLLGPYILLDIPFFLPHQYHIIHSFTSSLTLNHLRLSRRLPVQYQVSNFN